MLTLLVIYCVLITAASLLGGWLPNIIRIGHRHTQMVLSLVSGVMLGVALLHLLPKSIDLLDNEKSAMIAALTGLLFMFFMIRMFPFHNHDAVDAHNDCAHHKHDQEHEQEIKRADISWIGLAAGFAIHTVIDGIGLAAAVAAGSTADGAMLAGLGVFLAILLHKPLDALTVTSMMAVREWPKKQRASVNILFSLLCPTGALLFFLVLGSLGPQQEFILGIALAFSAGVFLCISLSDLLPEVQFHSHDRLAMSGMLLLGVAVAITLEILPL